MKLVLYKKEISSKIILLIVFILIFLAIYFTPIKVFLTQLFNLNVNNVGATLIVGLATSLITLAFQILTKLLRKGPISITIPHLNDKIKYFSTSEIKTSFNITEVGTYQLIHNGIILKGSNIYPSTDLPFNKLGNHITVCANFQAISKGKEGKYWRYGFEMKNEENNRLCLFHVDSEDFIVLYNSSNMVFRFFDNTFLSNKVNNLKVIASTWNNITHFSYYLNEIFIHQFSIENFKKIQLYFRAWSDNKKDHKIKINRINVAIKD